LVFVKLTIATPPDFDFRTAVCSHGFFVLAPNRWDPAGQALHTVVTLDSRTAVPLTISESASGAKLAIRSGAALAGDQQAAIRVAIRRMLRLDEDLSDFHTRCRTSASYRPAADMRFGRLLRSGSLFEDVVKVICTCNTSWAQTVTMVRNITDAWGVPVGGGDLKGFPTAEILAGVGPAEIRRRARTGYRSDYLHHFARDVADGRFDLAAIERFDGPSDDLHKMLRDIRGVGDYAAAHLCMLLGRYDRLAVDTELRRFLRQRYPRRRFTPSSLRRAYEDWHPYQFLAYWFDLWSDYTRRHGDAHQWDPVQVGRQITARPQSRPMG
jgi:3-methyladenine DNA glycosylase/8-oxoguanine DNA glycosylase